MSYSGLFLRNVRDVNIASCLITSNDKKNKKDIADIITDVYYYESILEPTLKVAVTYTDTGNSIQVDQHYKTLIEGLPIVNEENVVLKMTDSNKNKLDLQLYVNKPDIIGQEPTKSVVRLDLVSKEYIFNEKVRVNSRFDGKISTHIEKILKDFLKTSKKLNIENTSNNYNFMGNNKKPFYKLAWMCKKGIPEKAKSGSSAGFFFWETSEGFNFKSIDSLLSDMDSGNKKKYKSFILTHTPEGDGSNIPPGYDGKILDFSINDVTGDIRSKLQIGAYTTRTILFDPFSCYYEIINYKASDLERYLSVAGKNLPKLNPEFDIPGKNKDFSRTQYFILDKGVLPSGNTQEQLSKSKDENLDARNIISQSTMRYNQIFSSQVKITIVADFSLHAGDLVYIDIPELSSKDNKETNKQFGGFYVVADLCHHYSLTNGIYTSLLLIRDSLGKRGSPINNR